MSKSINSTILSQRTLETVLRICNGSYGNKSKLFLIKMSIIGLIIIVVFQVAEVRIVHSLKFDDYIDIAERHLAELRYDEALYSFQSALELNPRDPYVIQGVASALASLGRFLEAAEMFQSGGQLNNIPNFFLNAGMIYQQINLDTKALDVYHKCLSVSPQFRPCHIKLASLYNKFQNINEVQKHLQIAIMLDPSDFNAYVYLGDVYNNIKQFMMAIDAYKKAASLAQNKNMIYGAIADTYNNLKLYEDAYQYYALATQNLSLTEGIFPLELIIGKFFNSLDLGLWKNYEHESALIVGKAVVEAVGRTDRPSALSPYRSLFLPSSPSASLQIAKSWALGIFRGSYINTTSIPSFEIPSDRVEGRKGGRKGGALRVGYISRRFEDYPGTQLMLRLFQFHNRSKVTIYSYAHGPSDASSYRSFIANQSDFFFDISMNSIRDSANLIRGHDLDVLIDYDGQHDFNSLRLLCQRIAPVQFTWLGYAGTTGSDNTTGIDYIVADSVVAPPDYVGPFYSEKLVYLPGSYQPQDEFQGQDSLWVQNSASFSSSTSWSWFDPKIKHEVRSRLILMYRTNIALSKTFSLNSANNNTNNGNVEQLSSVEEVVDPISSSFWYICFNRIAKISPDTFGDWMSILVQTNLQSSKLIVMSESRAADIQLLVSALVIAIFRMDEN